MFNLKSKNAMSAIVATLLLLTFSVVSIYLLKDTVNLYKNDVEFGLSNKNIDLDTEILKVDGNYLYFQNNVVNNLNINSIKISNVTCNISSNLKIDKGLNTINISNCNTNFLNNTPYDVVVLTNYGVKSQYKMLKNIFIP